MFNETSYDCAAIKADCLSRFPENADGSDPKDALGHSLLLKCIDSQSQNRCFQAHGYDSPGATTYPLDVITNPDNPDYIWRQVFGTSWLVIGALVLGTVYFLRGR